MTQLGIIATVLVVAGSSLATVDGEVTPPLISEVSAFLSAPTTCTIHWNTDEPATSQVEYGLTQLYDVSSTMDPTMVTYHTVVLAGLTVDTVYHCRVLSRDTLGNQAVGIDYTFRVLHESKNLALGRPVSVSGSSTGYLASRIIDGVIAPTGEISGTWASDGSSSPHWVEIDLQQNVVVRSVRIYWAHNTSISRWMRSQAYTIQAWNGSAFVDLTAVDNRDTMIYPDTVITYDSTGAPIGFSVIVAGPSKSVESSAAGFPSVTTSRIRIYQPSNMGPESYPSIMWLTEVEVYSEDVVPPEIL